MIILTVSLKGFNEKTATFKVSGALTAGEPVAMADNCTVKACGSGEAVAGVAVNVKGGYACVQLSGYAEIPYSGTAPSVGFKVLAGDGKKGASVSQQGRSALVVNVDTDNSVMGIIL